MSATEQLPPLRPAQRDAPDFLYPLSEFFACGPPQNVQLLEVGGEPMPEPYRHLLVHERDMTSTLEAFHGETIGLRPVVVQREDDSVMRQVLLVGENSERPVEFGAIRIDLSGFGAEARGEILAAQRPLGSILSRHGVTYTSRPRCYFSLASDPCMARLLELRGPRTLFGRQNVLWSSQGKPLAEVVEILPPAEPTEIR